MKRLALSVRTGKEILRDPLTVAFSLGFPLVLLLLLTAIGANVPAGLFEIGQLAPGMAVFGLSFMTLFSAALLSRDRESAWLQRLYAAPLTAADFLAGYALPVFPIAVAQGAICYLAAIVLGLPVTVRVLYATAMIGPISALYVALGLLFGSVLNGKQVGGVCGALLTNLAAWCSGTWFDLELVGDGFKRVAYALPFVHAVELERAVLDGRSGALLPHLAWVLGYTAGVGALAVWLFLKQMKRQ